jgi:hypothetical protein
MVPWSQWRDVYDSNHFNIPPSLLVWECWIKTLVQSECLLRCEYLVVCILDSDLVILFYPTLLIFWPENGNVFKDILLLLLVGEFWWDCEMYRVLKLCFCMIVKPIVLYCKISIIYVPCFRTWVIPFIHF